jgi:cytosine/creatinine deaminase
MAADLLVRNARLPDGKGLVDLAVDDGRFVRIEPDLDLDADLTIDATARFVTAPLVDCHLHLDASLSAGKPRYNGSGTLIEGIRIWGELKGSLTVDDVLERARRVVKWSVAHGTLAIRAHADVSGENDAPLRGLLALRDELADLVTIQVTAFPQDGIYTDPADEARLERALRLGADCVGGIPHYEATAELGLREVHRVFELAKAYGRRIDVHCDETDDPSSRFLEVMADDTVRFGIAGRVTASHCTAMGSYEPYYSHKLHGFLRRAGLNVVVNPYANSLVQGRLDPYPKRRGFAQLKELLRAGVNVSLGNDVIVDPWYLLGDADLLHAAWLALHFCHMGGPRRDPGDARLCDDPRRADARHRGRLGDRGGQAGRFRRLRGADRSRGHASALSTALGRATRSARGRDDARRHPPPARGRRGDGHVRARERCGTEGARDGAVLARRG